MYERGDEIFTASLNQTNIDNNNNKFYIIQLLESDNDKKFWVWNRWGRGMQTSVSNRVVSYRIIAHQLSL